MRALVARKRGSAFGGIPSFSAAASESGASRLSVMATASATGRVAVRAGGHSDHAGAAGWKLPVRHSPQFRQIVVPLTGMAADQRMGMLP